MTRRDTAAACSTGDTAPCLTPSERDAVARAQVVYHVATELGIDEWSVAQQVANRLSFEAWLWVQRPKGAR